MADDLISSNDQENKAPLSRYSPYKNMSDDSESSPSPVKKGRGKAVRGLGKMTSLPPISSIECPQNTNKDSMIAPDDSSSDEEPKKKSRTARGRLNRGKTFPMVNNPPTTSLFQTSVYSSRVTQTWNDFEKGKVKPVVSDNEDDEEDISDIFKKTEKKGRRKRAARNKQEKSESEDAIDLDVHGSDEDDVLIEKVETVNTSITREKSPTPPPSPSVLREVRKKVKKTPKRIKTAFKKLEKAKAQQSRSAAEEDVCIIDDPGTPSASQEVKREVTLKVRSRSGVQRFTINKKQMLNQVMREMASHEAVAENRIAFVLNDTTLRPFDTPESLNIGVADIIDCHIRRLEDVNRESDSEDDDDINKIHLRVQGKGFKSRVEMKVDKKAPLGELMRKFAYDNGYDVSALKFMFDGEEITSTDTPEDLELEDDFCIDVIGA